MCTIRSSSHHSQWGVCLSSCWDTSSLGADTPWGAVPPDQAPLQRPVTRHAGIPPAMHAGKAHTTLETCCKACWDNTCKACWDTTTPVDRHTPVKPNLCNFVGARSSGLTLPFDSEILNLATGSGPNFAAINRWQLHVYKKYISLHRFVIFWN